MQPGGADDGRQGAASRVHVAGKFFARGDEKVFLKGVTYGTFAPDRDGYQCPPPPVVARDFAAMAAAGINVVRVYTQPPRWLLDLAAAHGLLVLVGLWWPQNVAFLHDRARRRAIEGEFRDAVRTCAGHPAVLAYAVGNEVPAPVVRWHGRRATERFLEGLVAAARDEDDALVTYVSYPSTEYLEVPSADFVSFNVYLEDDAKFRGYLARLQNLAGDRPLVLGELGLDSRRNGLSAQATALRTQLRTAFAAGCAGTFTYAWTDEWHCGGVDIDDWDFGITDRARRPKPALTAVSAAYAELPMPEQRRWPRISVVVCTYNGARTLGECLEAVRRLDYPDHEIIVVSDGSTDASPDIARAAGARVIETPNRGLSSARNTGLAAATGEIVAYVDDDAYPDPHWLRHLAIAFDDPRCAAAGGPNIAPPAGDPLVADCVARAPGGPIHVLLTDVDAEHLPGCNLAIRTADLRMIGGFDPLFRAAGDDVDVCWRLRDGGRRLRFVPGAVVFHHRRDSLGAYARQQRGYGAAEALLERKWPERYNAAGHVPWAGRVYAPGVADRIAGRRGRVYFGTWGTAAFQAVYPTARSLLAHLPGMPEWYLVVLALAAATAAGVVWTPFLLAAPVLALVVGAVVASCVRAARQAWAGPAPLPRGTRRRAIALTALLHLLQPAYRLHGRLAAGLTLWRHHRRTRVALPRPRLLATWTEEWAAPEDRLAAVESELAALGAVTRRGGAFDAWDLDIRGGLAAGARVRLLAEEHGAGRQLVRWRLAPRVDRLVLAAAAGLAVLAALSVLAGVLVPAALFAVAGTALAATATREAAGAVGLGLDALGSRARPLPAPTPARHADAWPASTPEPERVGSS